MNKLFCIYLFFAILNINKINAKESYCQDKCEKDLKLSSIETLNNTTKFIKLNNDNLVNIRGPILDSSIDSFLTKLQKIPSNDVFIFINSPGGSVSEGIRFIQVMNSLNESGKVIHCIVDKGASMAFIIFQSCSNRYIIEGSILMQHQISGGGTGSIENLRNRMKLLDNIYLNLNKAQAERLNLPLNNFLDKILSDWWMFDNEILDENAADEKIKTICHPELLKQKETLEYNSFLGIIKLTFSKCPLITEPSKIELKSENEDSFEKVNCDKTLKTIKENYLSFNKNIGYLYDL